MGFFTAAKPKITEKEIKELGRDLQNVHGMTEPQSKFVTDVLLRPHVEKSPYDSTPAIDKEEAAKIKTLLSDRNSTVYRELKKKYISDTDIEEIVEEIDKALITNR